MFICSTNKQDAYPEEAYRQTLAVISSGLIPTPGQGPIMHAIWLFLLVDLGLLAVGIYLLFAGHVWLGIFFLVFALLLMHRMSARLRWAVCLQKAHKAVQFGNYPEAEIHLREALKEVERYGPENFRRALLLNALADLYRMQGRYEEAGPFCQEALAILEKVHGPDHIYVAGALTQWGNIIVEQGKLAEAEQHYRRALAIVQDSGKAGQAELAGALNNLAKIYLDQGRYADAEPFYEEALAVLETAGSSEPNARAVVLQNLGVVRQRQQRLAEAEDLFRRALDLLHQAPGSLPARAMCLNNLAATLRRLGRLAEAEPYADQALEIQEMLTPDHPHLAHLLDTRAGLDLAQGRLQVAEAGYRKVLELWTRTHKLDTPDRVETLEDFATLLQQTGRDAEAQELRDRARDIRQRFPAAFGENETAIRPPLRTPHVR